MATTDTDAARWTVAYGPHEDGHAHRTYEAAERCGQRILNAALRGETFAGADEIRSMSSKGLEPVSIERLTNY